MRPITAQAAVDLHMHTTYSDGHWTPTALCDHLAANGFALAAVTDHDRVDMVEELQALGAARGVTIVPGVEVTTQWRDGITHLLCLGFAPAGGALAAVTAGVRDGQLANARAVNAELRRRGYAFPRVAEVLADKGGEINHPLDNIVLLRAHGYAPDLQTGLRLVTEAGHRTVAAPLHEAVAATHADGGLAIIAHPGRHESETWYDPPVLDDLRADGIPVDGIEAYYPRHTPDQVRAYIDYCARHGWLASSGSDSHGPRQRYPIAYPAGQIAPLLARLGITISA
jgi:predicted metal-dependent phosphoesterase TrpH